MVVPPPPRSSHPGESHTQHPSLVLQSQPSAPAANDRHEQIQMRSHKGPIQSTTALHSWHTGAPSSSSDALLLSQNAVYGPGEANMPHRLPPRHHLQPSPTSALSSAGTLLPLPSSYSRPMTSNASFDLPGRGPQVGWARPSFYSATPSSYHAPPIGAPPPGPLSWQTGFTRGPRYPGMYNRPQVLRPGIIPNTVAHHSHTIENSQSYPRLPSPSGLSNVSGPLVSHNAPLLPLQKKSTEEEDKEMQWLADFSSEFKLQDKKHFVSNLLPLSQGSLQTENSLQWTKQWVVETLSKVRMVKEQLKQDSERLRAVMEEETISAEQKRQLANKCWNTKLRLTKLRAILKDENLFREFRTRMSRKQAKMRWKRRKERAVKAIRTKLEQQRQREASKWLAEQLAQAEAAREERKRKEEEEQQRIEQQKLITKYRTTAQKISLMVKLRELRKMNLLMHQGQLVEDENETLLASASEYCEQARQAFTAMKEERRKEKQKAKRRRRKAVIQKRKAAEKAQTEPQTTDQAPGREKPWPQVSVADPIKWFEEANTDIVRLIEVRWAWDRYLVPPRTGGSAIPPHWIEVPEPSSSLWAEYLDIPGRGDQRSLPLSGNEKILESSTDVGGGREEKL